MWSTSTKMLLISSFAIFKKCNEVLTYKRYIDIFTITLIGFELLATSTECEGNEISKDEQPTVFSCANACRGESSLFTYGKHTSKGSGMSTVETKLQQYCSLHIKFFILMYSKFSHFSDILPEYFLFIIWLYLVKPGSSKVMFYTYLRSKIFLFISACSSSGCSCYCQLSVGPDKQCLKRAKIKTFDLYRYIENQGMH